MSHIGNDYLNDKAYEIAQVLIEEMFKEHDIDQVLNNLEMDLDNLGEIYVGVHGNPEIYISNMYALCSELRQKLIAMGGQKIPTEFQAQLGSI
jgi:thiamine kinase-like enzyme